MKKFIFQSIVASCNMQDDTNALTEGMCYTGVLRKQADGLLFEEEARPSRPRTRNPKIFNGSYITATRRKDGSIRFNFKELKKGLDVDVLLAGVELELKTAYEMK